MALMKLAREMISAIGKFMIETKSTQSLEIASPATKHGGLAMTEGTEIVPAGL